jgi:Cdc6-like AAA superfamily ATPase
MESCEKNYQACKGAGEHEKKDNEKKHKSTETQQNQVMMGSGKYIKVVISLCLPMFRMLEERLNVLHRETEDMKEI